MYRKFTADHIFTGQEILYEPAVLITDENGVINEIVDIKEAGDGIELFKGLLTPGFINAHCHLELSHLKGIIPEKTGLTGFVQLVMSNKASPEELKLDMMMSAEAEMYNTGIVAVGDVCNTADSLPVKQQNKLLWHNFIEVAGFTDRAANNRLDDMKKVYEQFQATSSRQKITFSPHAPYSVSKKLFHLLNDETEGQLITIHNQESAAENDLFICKNGDFLKLYKNLGIDISSFEPTGKSSFQSWLPMFTNRQSIISVHNTFISEPDLAFSASQSQNFKSQVFYCLCINANKYIEQKCPPIELLRKSHSKIILGTDSYASNFQLNILEEIKSIQQETNHDVPLSELLKWATINGAKALQLDHSVGSFEKSKTPGIVLIDGLDKLQTNQQSFARRIL